MMRKKAFTIVEVLVVSAIFIAVLMMLTPFVKMAKERASSIKCINNLRQISLSLHRFASDNGGVFPSKLKDLYPKYIADERIFDCPASESSYCYKAGLTEKSAGDIVLYDAQGFHGKAGRNVLRADGSISRQSDV